LNIAHECIDRHATDPDRLAVRVAHADGRDELITFRAIADASSRIAHWLASRGVGPGDRVAVMLDPSLPFYAAMFGAMKRGAIAVPLFTLFGPDGVRLRVSDCAPRVLLTNAEKAANGPTASRVRDHHRRRRLHGGVAPALPAEYTSDTRADDLASSNTPPAPRGNCRRR
jgi:acetyl-CoA synthetase